MSDTAQHWSMQIAKLAPAGKRIHHFRSLGSGKNHQKIFHAGDQVFIVKFSYDKCLEVVSRRRRSNESLLGIEGSIEEQLRKEGLV